MRDGRGEERGRERERERERKRERERDLVHAKASRLVALADFLMPTFLFTSFFFGTAAADSARRGIVQNDSIDQHKSKHNAHTHTFHTCTPDTCWTRRFHGCGLCECRKDVWPYRSRWFSVRLRLSVWFAVSVACGNVCVCTKNNKKVSTVPKATGTGATTGAGSSSVSLLPLSPFSMTEGQR
jgi:hypothetical protein